MVMSSWAGAIRRYSIVTRFFILVKTTLNRMLHLFWRLVLNARCFVQWGCARKCNGTINLSLSPVVLIHHDKVKHLSAYTPTIVSRRGLRQHRGHSCIIFTLKSATNKMCVAPYSQRCLYLYQEFTAV